MKKIFFTLALAATIIACNSDGYTVNGTVDKLENGAKIYLETTDESGAFISLDSVTATEDNFQFKGKTQDLQLAFIRIGEIPARVPFVLESGKINIQAFRDSLHTSIVSGSANNDALNAFNKTLLGKQNKIRQYQVENQHKLIEAQQGQDNGAIQEFMQKFQEMQQDINSFVMEYPSKNPKSFISLIIIQQQVGNPMAEMDKLQKEFDALNSKIKESKTGKLVAEALKKKVTN